MSTASDHLRPSNRAVEQRSRRPPRSAGVTTAPLRPYYHQAAEEVTDDDELQSELLSKIHELQFQLDAADKKYVDLATQFDGVCAELADAEAQVNMVRQLLHSQLGRNRKEVEVLESKVASLQTELQDTQSALTQANRSIGQQVDKARSQAEIMRQLEEALEEASRPVAVAPDVAPEQTEATRLSSSTDLEQWRSLSMEPGDPCDDDESIAEVCTATKAHHQRMSSTVVSLPLSRATQDAAGPSYPDVELEPEPPGPQWSTSPSQTLRRWSMHRESLPPRVDSLWQELVDLTAQSSSVSTADSMDDENQAARDESTDADREAIESLARDADIDSATKHHGRAEHKVMVSVGVQTDSLNDTVFEPSASPQKHVRASTVSSNLVRLGKMREDLLDWLSEPDEDSSEFLDRLREEKVDVLDSLPSGMPTSPNSIPLSLKRRSVTNESVHSLLLSLQQSENTRSNSRTAFKRDGQSFNSLTPQSGFMMPSSRRNALARSMPRTSVTTSSEEIGQIVSSTKTSPMTKKVAQCMIGTYMYKTVRKARQGVFRWRRGGDAEPVRHKRFVALRLSDLSVSWSFTRPAVGMQLGLRKFQIDQVLDIEEASPLVGGHDRSLLLLSGGQSIRFTCETQEDHQLWLEVLRWLVLKREAGEEPVNPQVQAGSDLQKRTQRVHVARQAQMLRRSVSLGSVMKARPPPISLTRPSMPEVRDKQSRSVAATASLASGELSKVSAVVSGSTAGSSLLTRAAYGSSMKWTESDTVMDSQSDTMVSHGTYPSIASKSLASDAQLMVKQQQQQQRNSAAAAV